MGKHTQSIDLKVLRRIFGHGQGWVFTPGDFQDFGSPLAVNLALMRHTRAGTLRRLARGLYDYPRHDPDFGLLPPSTEAIVVALKGRDASRIQASGAHAANMLGLTEQVPVKLVFLTDGRSRHVRLGNRQIIFKHATPRQLATAGRISGLVIQALRWIGKNHVDEKMIATLARRLSARDKNQLLRDCRYAPAWVAEIMRQVARMPMERKD